MSAEEHMHEHTFRFGSGWNERVRLHRVLTEALDVRTRCGAARRLDRLSDIGCM